jgi:hypothetical protein
VWRAVKHAQRVMTCEVNASRMASFGIDNRESRRAEAQCISDKECHTRQNDRRTVIAPLEREYRRERKCEYQRYQTAEQFAKENNITVVVTVLHGSCAIEKSRNGCARYRISCFVGCKPVEQRTWRSVKDGKAIERHLSVKARQRHRSD